MTTTYGHNTAGEVTNIVYSDGTPRVSVAYDRLGRITNVVQQNTLTNRLIYNLAGQVTLDWVVGSCYELFYHRTFGRSATVAVLEKCPG